MGKRRRRSGSGRMSKWVYGVLGVLAVGAVAVTAVAMQPRTPETTIAWNRDHTALPADSPEPIPVRTQLADVMPRLRDMSRPFNIVTLGDSTGAGRQTWTALTGEWIGQKYGRTVKGSQWDIHSEPNGYGPVGWNLSEGEGAPVTYWNGSSAAKDAVYSLENLDELAPLPGESVDLVFINHGHNHADYELLPEARDLIEEATARFPNAAIVVILQNPEREASPHRETQRMGVAKLGRWAQQQGYPTIDVYTPFSEQDVEALIDDTLYHPTLEGYEFWAGVVEKALDDADPSAS